MKVFNLRCDQEHEFEGWFPSVQESERQLEQHLIRCPICDSAELSRLPSAPRLNLMTQSGPLAATGEGLASGEGGGRDPGATPMRTPARTEVMAAHPQAQWIRALRELIRSTEDVGARFAEEARRIHYQESPERAIRGVATDRERAELEEEGIDILSIPIPAMAKEPLQ